MKKKSLIAVGATLLSGVFLSGLQAASAEEFVLVIHGGAGAISKKNISAEQEAAYRAKLTEALVAGRSILANKGTALDAIEATINVMEDSPLFNAGKGAVFTHEERNEMDASIMDGRTLNAGAIAGVTRVKNPIGLAREVMENSKHVMLAGTGAEEFAKLRGVELVDPSYFATERRLKQVKRIKAKNAGVVLDHSSEKISAVGDPIDPDHKFGTVGAVALDVDGNIAAGTSTGGMTNKRWMRIGDAPIIGAGTYASNESCGVSSTGHGEYFIRLSVAYNICAMMEYKGVSLQEAADTVIHDKLTNLGGTGGIVSLDKNGNVAMVFNTEGMYRGYVKGDGEPSVAIYEK